jgi:hypothetical protein
MDSTLNHAATSLPTHSEPNRDLPLAGSSDAPATVSRAQLWTGRGLSGFIALLLAADTAFKLLRAPEAIQGTVELGYPASAVFGIGLLELACLVAYLIPRTAVFGAVLLTGYLGGAIATHVRLGNPLFTHVLFPVYVAAFIWGGLYVRDLGVRALLPFRRRGARVEGSFATR